MLDNFVGLDGLPTTLVELLGDRARHKPDQSAFIFLGDRENTETRISYGQLDRRARAIAGILQQTNADDKPILLLYPPGLDYIVAFFGCLYAGVPAVPVYPPHSNRPTPRLQSIATNAQANTALTTTDLLESMSSNTTLAPELSVLRWLDTSNEAEGLTSYQEVPLLGDATAMIQYTSGSTGKPHGVVLTHRNLLYNSWLIYRALEHGSTSVGVSWLPPYHDMGLIGGILQPVFGGFPGVLMSPLTFLQRPLRWLQAISYYRATTSGGPNFAYDLCARSISPIQRTELDLSSWEVAFNGSEPVRADTLERFTRAFVSCGFQHKAFYPCYGLAEATLFVSGGRRFSGPVTLQLQAEEIEKNRVVEAVLSGPGSRILVGCGQSQPGQQVRIVDPNSLHELRDDTVGEIWVTGPSISNGYWNNPAESKATFQARIADASEGSFLHTGDLGFLHNGDLFITGRLKDVIIIRGRNHYPQDIELTVEQSHPVLRPGFGAAFSIDDADQELLVVVHEIDRRQRKPEVAEIAGAIRQAVAEAHELDVYAVVLLRAGTIPKTTSGKIQRFACREGFLNDTLTVVGMNIRELNSEFVPSQSEDLPHLTRESLLEASHDQRRNMLAAYLRSCISHVLNVPASRLDEHSPLTTLGLDSLMAVQLKHQIESDLGLLLTMVDLLCGPSIDQLISEILGRVEVLSLQPRDGLGAAHEAKDEYPLSYGQRAMWFMHEFAPHSSAYHIAAAMRIYGLMNTDVLRRTFEQLIVRHPSLRATVSLIRGELVQKIHEQADFVLQVRDAVGSSEDVLQGRLAEEIEQPFDLQNGPLLRVSLFRVGPAEYVLLLVIHHIAADLWSLTILAHEFSILYGAEVTGTSIVLSPFSVQYTDYARWQTERMTGEDGERLWRYWEARLAGAPATLDLPTDRPRPHVQTFRGATHHFNLTSELTRALKGLAKEQDVTVYMVLLAALQTLLHRYTDQDDILVGSPMVDRSRADLAGLVGYFGNPVVLRSDLSRDPSFLVLLKKVRQTVLAAFEHQDYPFPLLVERLQVNRDARRSSLFQVMFVWQRAPLLEEQGLAALVLNRPHTRITLGDLVVETFALKQQAVQFDLTLSMAAIGDEFAGSLQYNVDLFDADTIVRFAGHFETLLQGLVDHPTWRLSDLPMLRPTEQRQVLVEWNQTDGEYRRNVCVHQLFEAQVERSPEIKALIFRGHTMSYLELNRRSNRVAHALLKIGVGPETGVGICLEPSNEMIVGLMGILKAGGTYVPLDPSYPFRRLAYMLKNAGVRVMVTEEKLRAGLPLEGVRVLSLDGDATAIEAESDENTASSVTAENLSHIIYTSGSTGWPKGVMVKHTSVVNLWIAIERAIYDSLGKAHLRSCLISPLSFDGSIREYLTLARGHTLVIAPQEFRRDPASLLQYLRENAVEEFYCTPTQLQLLIAAGLLDRRDYAPELVLLGGEQISAPLWELLARQPATIYYNLYGPTECTVDATFTLITAGAARPTIGRPLLNTTVYILDKRLNPLPVGVPGELYIGGIGLARGYAGDPQQTAHKFIPHPFAVESGSRMYRTGDHARFLPGGQIEFLARLDNQVKLRGFSIELGEIEATLTRHPRLLKAVVMLREDRVGERQLVAYYVPRAEGDVLSATELRGFLQEYLPEHMIPLIFVPLATVPITLNGKVDEASLPIPEPVRPDLEEGYIVPGGELERAVAGIWLEVLGIKWVGPRANFFDLGGNSFRIVRVQALVRQRLDLEVALVKLFQYPTLEALVSYLSGLQKPDQGRSKRGREIGARRRERLSTARTHTSEGT